MRTMCWIPDEPPLRWDELWRSVTGSSGQPPLRCPQVRWGDGSPQPKTHGDGGIQVRTLALPNGWANLWGMLFGQIWGDLRHGPVACACGICILSCGLAALWGRSFPQKKLHQPEAAFWGRKDKSECVCTWGMVEPSLWAEHPWQVAGGRAETMSPECWLLGEIRLAGEEMGWGWSRSSVDGLRDILIGHQEILSYSTANTTSFDTSCTTLVQPKMILGRNRWQQTKLSHF